MRIPADPDPQPATAAGIESPMKERFVLLWHHNVNGHLKTVAEILWGKLSNQLFDYYKFSRQ